MCGCLPKLGACADVFASNQPFDYRSFSWGHLFLLLGYLGQIGCINISRSCCREASNQFCWPKWSSYIRMNTVDNDAPTFGKNDVSKAGTWQGPFGASILVCLECYDDPIIEIHGLVREENFHVAASSLPLYPNMSQMLFHIPHRIHVWYIC